MNPKVYDILADVYQKDLEPLPRPLRPRVNKAKLMPLSPTSQGFSDPLVRTRLGLAIRWWNMLVL
jgi:hypothetical protein